MQIKTRMGIFIPSLIENMARLPVFNALRVTRIHVPERLFMCNNSIYQEGGGVDWGTFCYPLTRAIKWGGEQDLVISPEINQCKRVQILLPALPRGPSEQINSPSFIPVASSRGICLSEDLHLSPDRLPLRKKMGGNEEKTQALGLELCVARETMRGKKILKTLLMWEDRDWHVFKK